MFGKNQTITYSKFYEDFMKKEGDERGNGGEKEIGWGCSPSQELIIVLLECDAVEFAERSKVIHFYHAVRDCVEDVVYVEGA